MSTAEIENKKNKKIEKIEKKKNVFSRRWSGESGYECTIGRSVVATGTFSCGFKKIKNIHHTYLVHI